MSNWKIFKQPLRVPVAVATALALTAGTVLGWVASRWSLKLVNFNWLELFTALGTVGAVIVAVGIALREDLRRRNDSANAASLVAAKFAPRLRTACGKLSHLSGVLGFEISESYSVLFKFGRELLDARELDTSCAQFK